MVIQGRELMLFKKEVETYKALGSATNHTLNVSREQVDVSSKDTGMYNDKIPGIVSWSIGIESLYVTEDFDALMDSLLAGEEIEAAFSLASNANAVTGKPKEGWTIDKGGYEGKCVITDLQVNTPHNDKATYTATLTGKGPIKKRSGV